MKKYFVYIDDGRYVYKLAVPAKNEKAAADYVTGNGDIIAIKDVTKDYPISAEAVAVALQNANFSSKEIDFIVRCLTFNNIAE